MVRDNSLSVIGTEKLAEYQQIKAALKRLEELEAENERLKAFKESVREIATTYGDGSVSERMVRIKELFQQGEE